MKAVLKLMVISFLMLRAVSAAAAEDVDALLARCAPNVNADTMKAVMNVESRGHVYVLADAGPLALPWSQRKSMVRSLYPSSKDEAVKMVQDLLANGHTVSIGLSQINDRNLPRMGLSVADVLDPCANVKAGSTILMKFYEDAVRTFGVGPQALRAALSAYNSGDFNRGAADGYVDLVYQNYKRPIELKTGAPQSTMVPALDAPETGRVAAGAGTRRAVSKGSTRQTSPVLRRPKYAREDFTMIVTSFDAGDMK